jgi:hypothetical protein
MTNSTNTTRRGFLSTAAALTASAAVAIPANAADASTPDPIFEAIEVHKAARLAFENAVSRGSALDEELPGEKTRSWITVWEQTIVETDDPRWIDSVREVDRTSDAATDAAYALALQPRWREWWGCCNTPSASSPRNGRKACSPMTTPRPGHGITS